jgi:hypothetical protein
VRNQTPKSGMWIHALVRAGCEVFVWRVTPDNQGGAQQSAVGGLPSGVVHVPHGSGRPAPRMAGRLPDRCCLAGGLPRMGGHVWVSPQAGMRRHARRFGRCGWWE